jgi:inorganic pyrophosphatase/exopolyphosphatase
VGGNHNDKKIHVVIGNEACDLDSAVSALTYGYFLHKVNSVIVTSHRGVPTLTQGLETVHRIRKIREYNF